MTLLGTGGATQWSNGTGGAIYYNGGNIGIGTTVPATKLHVFDASDAGLTIGGDSDGDQARLRFFENSNPGAETGIEFHYDGAQPNNLYVNEWSTGTMTATPIMTIQRAGKVGIGTNAPSEKLEVNGNVKMGYEIQTGTGPPPLAPVAAQAGR